MKLAHDRAWRAANPEVARAIALRYSRANPDKVNAANAEWRRRNPEKAHAYYHARRARVQGGGGSYSLDNIVAQYELQSWCCFYCYATIEGKFRIDHFIPLSRWGSNWPENIVLACQQCNLSKGAKMPWECMPEKTAYPARPLLT